MKNINKKNSMKDILKTKGFYISLMTGAICIVAVAAVFFNSIGINNAEKENTPSRVFENLAELSDETGDSNAVDNNSLNDMAVPGALGNMPDDTNAQDGQALQNNSIIQDGTIDGQDQTVSQITEENVQNVQEDVQEPQDVPADAEDTDPDGQIGPGRIILQDGEQTADDKPDKDIAVMKSGKGVENLSFNQEKGIMWPVKGEVIMNYSPDKSIYYKTLGAYKTNPAIIIAAAEGANVCSGADAVVTGIGENEEIGKFVETAIGDDYKIIYGQLDNIQVKKGSSIKEGEFIGTIASPTKYYVEEGSNLYLKMLCKDETTDPMIFLR